MHPTTRVLLVDDDDDSREMYSLYLEDSGLQVEQARSAAEGLRKARSEPPDVVVLDLWLPDRDGFTVCETLKSDVQTKNIRLIALTGVAGGETNRRAASAGFAKILLKPFAPDDLLNEIRTTP